VTSERVLEAAQFARSRQVILPVLLEPVTPPENLAEVQATALTAWIGEERSFELRPFLDRLRKKLGGVAPALDEAHIAEAITKLTRVEVVEAAFEFCAARLESSRQRQTSSGASEEILGDMRATYDKLCEILAPVSSDDIHALIVRHENAFTP
jgi:hypothetical protein